MTPITPSDWAERAASTQWDAREIGTVLVSIDKAYTAIHGPPMESDDADSRDPFYIGDYVEKAFKRFVNENTDLRSQLVAAQRERDEAVAHDRQTYPTASAYETACSALLAWMADMKRAGVLCGQTDDEYPLQAVERAVKEHAKVLADLAQSRAELGEVRSTLGLAMDALRCFHAAEIEGFFTADTPEVIRFDIGQRRITVALEKMCAALSGDGGRG